MSVMCCILNIALLRYPAAEEVIYFFRMLFFISS